jgi:hypothetical protein
LGASLFLSLITNEKAFKEKLPKIRPELIDEYYKKINKVEMR